MFELKYLNFLNNSRVTLILKIMQLRISCHSLCDLGIYENLYMPEKPKRYEIINNRSSSFSPELDNIILREINVKAYTVA